MFSRPRSSRTNRLLSTSLAALGLATPTLAGPNNTFGGHPITTLDACAYLAEFDAGGIDADLDDGSFTGQVDGGVTIDDILYAIYIMGVQSPNDQCSGALDISGFGRFNYATCIPYFIGFSYVGTFPTTGPQGQNNVGGVRCVGGVVDKAIPNDLWYKWTSPVTGLVLINTVTQFGSNLTNDDTSIAVYGRATAAPLVVPACPGGNATCAGGGGGNTKTLGFNEDSGGPANKHARVAFRAIAGNIYLIQIGGASPCAANLTQPDCRFFEILDLSANPVSFQTAGFPGPAWSVRVTCDPPFAFASVTAALQAAGVCAGAIPCGTGNTRRCIDLVAAGPTQPPPGTHVVIEMKYTGITNPNRCALRFGHQPQGGTWVNARCGNDINSRIITGVVDSFSPFSITQEGCPTDVNGDGGVGIEDLLDYLEIFDAGLTDADINLDEGITIEDLLEFLQAFDNGC